MQLFGELEPTKALLVQGKSNRPEAAPHGRRRIVIFRYFFKTGNENRNFHLIRILLCIGSMASLASGVIVPSLVNGMMRHSLNNGNSRPPSSAATAARRSARQLTAPLPPQQPLIGKRRNRIFCELDHNSFIVPFQTPVNSFRK